MSGDDEAVNEHRKSIKDISDASGCPNSTTLTMGNEFAFAEAACLV